MPINSWHRLNSFHEVIAMYLCLQDTKLVIDRYKSGFVPPEDFAFEAASGADTTDSASTHHHPHNHLTAARGTVSGNKIKKRGGLLSIFSSNKVRGTYWCPHSTRVTRTALGYLIMFVYQWIDPIVVYCSQWVYIIMVVSVYEDSIVPIKVRTYINQVDSSAFIE